MQLSIRRSQRDGGVFGGKVIFALDAQIRPSSEEHALIKRYKLGKETVYASDAARRHAAATIDASERGGVGGLAKAAMSAGMASLSLRCTIDSLAAGQRIECKDLPELLAAEEAIVEACNNTKAFLEAAATFDGRELVMDI
jgi:hypothetical protein